LEEVPFVFPEDDPSEVHRQGSWDKTIGGEKKSALLRKVRLNNTSPKNSREGIGAAPPNIKKRFNSGTQDSKKGGK